jgi:hypothetical protein
MRLVTKKKKKWNAEKAPNPRQRHPRRVRVLARLAQQSRKLKNQRQKVALASDLSYRGSASVILLPAALASVSFGYVLVRV